MPTRKCYQRGPERLFPVRQNVKKWARSTSTVALCGIKFFYENTIQRPWPTLLFIRPGREKKLLVVLRNYPNGSRAECLPALMCKITPGQIAA